MSASLGPICFNGSLNFLHRLAAPVPEVSSEEAEEDDESQKVATSRSLPQVFWSRLLRELF